MADAGDGPRVRLKCRFRGDWRYVTVPANIRYTVLMQRFERDYGASVSIKYNDSDGDEITVRSQRELEEAFDEYLESGQSTFKLYLLEEDGAGFGDGGAQMHGGQAGGARGANDMAALAPLIEQSAASLLQLCKDHIEPQVSDVVKRLEYATQGKLVGFVHRFKTQASLVRKLGKDVAKAGAGADVAAITRGIKDALRYTLLFETDQYTTAVSDALDALHASDMFKVVQVKNFWVVAGDAPADGDGDDGFQYELSHLRVLEDAMKADAHGPGEGPGGAGDFAAGMVSVRLRGGVYQMTSARTAVYEQDRTQIRRGDEYQGINSVILHVPTGVMWELQYHTAESIQVKEASHRVYEIFRVETDPVRKREQYQEMVEMWDSVPRPAGVETIGSGVGLQPATELPPIPDARIAEWTQSQRNKSRALVVARKVLKDWIASREEVILTALFEYLCVKHEAALNDLNDRLLGKYPLRWKVSQVANEHGIAFSEAAARIPNTLQYTVVVDDPERYTAVIPAMVEDVLKNDQTFVSRTNFWRVVDQQHRGIEFVFKTAGGRLFQVSFFTAETYTLRGQAQRQFEARASTTAEAAHLAREREDIRAAWADITVPADIDLIDDLAPDGEVIAQT